MIVSSIRSRSDLPKLLNDLGLTNIGAEVGVREGKFSEHILLHWDGVLLHSIDAWRHIDGVRAGDNVSDTAHFKVFRKARERLSKFGNRSNIIKAFSGEAAHLMCNESLDFVYIDAAHQYDCIRNDILLWLPKVKSGGILAGHDYADGVFNGYSFGVKKAVSEILGEVHVTCEKPPKQSWIWRKP